MAIISTKMNELSLNDDDCSIKQHLVYNDDKFKQGFLDSLNHQRKQDRGMYDVIFITGANEHKVFAHRAVLSIGIPRLDDMLDSKGDISYVCLPDLEPFAVEALVEFIYSSKLELSPDRVWDVLSAADRMEMNEIVDTCQRYIHENMLSDYWLYARQIAVERRFSWLLSAVDNYVVQNFAAISRSAEFLQLPRLQVELISKRSDEKAENERPNEILGLVVKWCEEKLQEEDLIQGLMEHTHLLYLTVENTLKDCKGSNLDTNENVVVTDAQMEYIRQQSNQRSASPVKSPRRLKNYNLSKDLSGRKALHFRKNDSCELPPPEKQFQLVASTASSEGCYIGLAVIATELICISAYYNEQTSSCNSSISSDCSSIEEIGLSLIKPMIRGRCSVGVGELDNKVYAVGGYDREHCLDLVECFDQQKNEWVPTTPLTSARGRFGLSCLNGKLYAIGGSSGTSELRSGECFDPETKKWSKIASMSICRSNFGVCVLDGKLFAVGGTDGRHALESVEVYNPETNSWTNVSPMQVGRETVCVEVVNGCLYACGGYNVWHCLDSVECYSLKEDCWSMVAPLHTARRGAGAAAYNGKLFIAGGSDGSSSLQSVECYDPETNTWSYVASMNSHRHYIGVTVSSGFIFAVGGFDGVAFLNTTEFYDPELNKWSAFTQVYQE